MEMESAQAKINEARDVAKKMTNQAGVSESEEKALNEWLGRIEEVNDTVKYLLSDEYKPEEDMSVDAAPTEVVQQDATETAEPALKPIAPHQKARYTADYSRFDKPDFIRESKPVVQKKNPVVEPEPLPETKPDRSDKKALASYLMKKESLTYKDKGNAAFKKGDYTEAEAMYSSGVALDERCCVLRNNRAQARLKLGDWSGALSDCNHVLAPQRDPHNMKAVKRRAVALQHLRRSKDALDDINAAIKHEGSTKELRKMLSEAAHEAGFEAQVAEADPALLRSVRESAARIRDAMRQSRMAGPTPPPTPEGIREELAKAASGVKEDDDTPSISSNSTALIKELMGAVKILRGGGDTAAIAFHWEGATHLLLSYIKEFRAAIAKSLAPATLPHHDSSLLQSIANIPGVPDELDVLVTQLFTLLTEVFSAGYVMRDSDSSPSFREGSLFAALLGILVEAFTAEKLCCFAALRLMVTLTEGSNAMRLLLREHLPVEKLMSLPHHTEENGDDGTLSLLLQLVDNLLKSPEWGDTLSAQPLPHYILPLMSEGRSRTVRDSAAAAVMRLTTDRRFREFMTSTNLPLPGCGAPGGWGSLRQGQRPSQSILHYLSHYLEREVASMESPFAIEAILATLQNCLVDAPQGQRGAGQVLQAVATPANALSCLALIGLSERSADGQHDYTNIQARALGLLSRAVSIREIHGILKDPSHGAVDLLMQFAARNGGGVPVRPEGGDSPVDYAEQCRENAVSTVAALVSKEAELFGGAADASAVCDLNDYTEHIFSSERTCDILVRHPTVSVLRRCLSSGDRVCGNAALILSELSKDAEWVARFNKEAGGMVGPLLGVIKQKRAEQFEEERQERPASTSLNVQAQRNAAITLARLAKDPANLAELREKQGIDILSTTLKYVNSAPKASRLTTAAAAAGSDGGCGALVAA